MTPEEFFAAHPTGLAVFELIRQALPDAEIRTTKSQVAFRHDRAFAWLWLPGAYLKHPGADVVLSLALGRHDDSPRWKQAVQVASQHWMHHLEVHDLADVDAEVMRWLREAADRAHRPASGAAQSERRTRPSARDAHPPARRKRSGPSR